MLRFLCPGEADGRTRFDSGFAGNARDQAARAFARGDQRVGTQIFDRFDPRLHGARRFDRHDDDILGPHAQRAGAAGRVGDAPLSSRSTTFIGGVPMKRAAKMVAGCA